MINQKDGSSILLIMLLLSILMFALFAAFSTMNYRHLTVILLEKQMKKKWVHEGLLQYGIAYVKKNHYEIPHSGIRLQVDLEVWFRKKNPQKAIIEIVKDQESEIINLFVSHQTAEKPSISCQLAPVIESRKSKKTYIINNWQLT